MKLFKFLDKINYEKNKNNFLLMNLAIYKHIIQIYKYLFYIIFWQNGDNAKNPYYFILSIIFLIKIYVSFSFIFFN